MAEEQENVIEQAAEQGPAEGQEQSKKQAIGNTFRSFLDGSLLSRDMLLKQLPFLLFLTLLAVVYIANRYQAEKLVRESSDLQIELKELRSEQISITSELMRLSQQSEVARLVEEYQLGLKESVEPPHKIVVKKED